MSEPDDLQTMTREQLEALVRQLRCYERVQQQTLDEIIDERDAAQLLNKLCHF